MTVFDYIVIGGGITGSALAYELAKLGHRVLLLEKDSFPPNATFYSYGGLAYWSGATEINRRLFSEGIDIYRGLDGELGGETEFREIDLVLTIGREDDPPTILKNYDVFPIKPRLLSPDTALELEPLLNKEAISGVLHLPHGHINAYKTNLAYQEAFKRLKGTIAREQAIELLKEGDRIKGVRTPLREYLAPETIVCAGGLTRSFLQEAGIFVRTYFTRAAVIKTPPSELRLRTLVMSAIPKRINLEREITVSENEPIWQQPKPDIIASVMEAGAVQFLDRSFYLGQISSIVTDPFTLLNNKESELEIRASIGQVLPALATLPGECYQCLVAFSGTRSPLVGKIKGWEGIQAFSGFTSTLIMTPSLARRFARHLSGGADDIITSFAA